MTIYHITYTSACKGHPRNDLYSVGRGVKPYSFTHSLCPNWYR